jgi:Tfp pilus assembly protein PilN
MPAASPGASTVRPEAIATRKGRVAALHRQGEQWRLLVAEMNGDVEVLDARTLARGDVGAVRAALQEWGNPRLVRVLPAACVVCRLIAVPDGPAAEIDSALRLIAEAELPSTMPAHRRGSGLVDMPGDPGKRAAALVGWSGDAGDPTIAGQAETWTAEPVALEALIRRSGTGMILYADAAAGSVSLAAKGPQRGVLRALREHAESENGWELLIAERAVQAMRSAAIDIESTRGFAASPGLQLRIDPDAEAALAASVKGLRRDPVWLGQFGVALGAAIASSRGGGLCSLTFDAPRRTRAPLEAAAEWLARPSRAWPIAAAGLAIALLAPWGLSAGRAAILSSKTGGIALQQQAEAEIALRTAFATELQQRRWPMSKLLADLAGASPVGVIVESIRLEVGQRLVVQGSADSLDLVNQLQSKLNESGVFAEASIDRTQATPDKPGVRFDVSARVVRPFSQPKGLEDFAASTLAQRLYGERASQSSTAAGSPAPSEDRPAPRGRRAASESPESPGAAPRERSRSAATPEKKADIPPPISDDDIAKLDANTAMKEWTTRQRASKQAGIDQATRDRLKAEADKAKARMTAARSEAKPGGGS